MTLWSIVLLLGTRPALALLFWSYFKDWFEIYQPKRMRSKMVDWDFSLPCNDSDTPPKVNLELPVACPALLRRWRSPFLTTGKILPDRIWSVSTVHGGGGGGGGLAFSSFFPSFFFKLARIKVCSRTSSKVMLIPNKSVDIIKVSSCFHERMGHFVLFAIIAFSFIRVVPTVKVT